MLHFFTNNITADFPFRDIVNTNTSNDSDKSDKTLVDVSILVPVLLNTSIRFIFLSGFHINFFLAEWLNR